MSDTSHDLSGQIKRVYDALRDGVWRTLPELHELTGDSVSSVSAQIRHLRKPEHGLHTIIKRRRGANERGLFEYRLLGGDSPSQEAA